MDQTQYWMWTNNRNNKFDRGSHIFASSSSTTTTTTTSPLLSWEEQAFAEDAAAGADGGCTWPPRSYSCTFCKREFRSAQALGGHMNVHRRDRARLKQSQQQPPQTENNTNTNSILLNQGTIFEPQQSTSCNFQLFNPNLDFDHHHHRVVAKTSSPIRVSAPTSEITKNKTQFLFPHVQEQSTNFPPKPSLDNSQTKSHPMRKSVEFTTPSRDKGDIVKTDLSISLNLVICRNNPSGASDDDDDDDEDRRCKRRRIDPEGALNLFKNKQDSYDVISANEQLRILSCIDDVDLELRLGDPPNV